MKGFYSVFLLFLSNSFMTLAWYGHLYFKKISWLAKLGLWGVIMVSWGLAFFEYIFQVPANRIGYEGNGGPFSLFELKVIQEAVSLTVFTIFAIWIFKSDRFAWNYLVGFVFLVLAVFFIFKKW
ncbi:MAG: DMT family protein [Cytophagaceae bacterium]